MRVSGLPWAAGQRVLRPSRTVPPSQAVPDRRRGGGRPDGAVEAWRAEPRDLREPREIAVAPGGARRALGRGSEPRRGRKGAFRAGDRDVGALEAERPRGARDALVWEQAGD